MEQTPAKHCKMKKGAGERETGRGCPTREVSLSLSERAFLIRPPAPLSSPVVNSFRSSNGGGPVVKSRPPSKRGWSEGRGAFSLFVGIGGEQRSDR